MVHKTILVVEDNQVSRELVVELLTAAGYIALEAEDGRGLIERVKRERPNLILMDLHLPYIDGFTLTRQLTRLVLRRGRSRSWRQPPIPSRSKRREP